MIAPGQAQRAEDFLALHHGPRLLVLPNAWDVVSARLYEVEGFAAVGTTSAGISSTLGYPDGERVTRFEMIDVVSRIANRISLPVSADIEAGYATAPEGVARTAEAALRVGAVGINLEDASPATGHGLFAEELQAHRLHAIREMATAAGIHLVINARTDVYLLGEGS